jgi:hypothetical protein
MMGVTRRGVCSRGAGRSHPVFHAAQFWNTCAAERTRVGSRALVRASARAMQVGPECDGRASTQDAHPRKEGS